MQKLMIFFFIIWTIAFPLLAEDDLYLEPQKKIQVSTIIIDPGHGGLDHGAVSQHQINGELVSLIEKTITLNIAQILKEHLEKALPDKRILLSRDNDTLIHLADRITYFNSIPLELDETAIILSIHANSSYNKNRRGYELFTNFDADSLFTKILKSEFTNTFGNDLPFLGIMNGNHYLPRNAQVPAIIFEMGFLSNEEDVKMLYNPSGIEKSAGALARWVCALLQYFDDTSFVARFKENADNSDVVDMNVVDMNVVDINVAGY